MQIGKNSFPFLVLEVSSRYYPLFQIHMLNFAKTLLGSKPIQSKEESGTSVFLCDFFVLEGDRWISLSDEKCTIEFGEKPKTGASVTIKCDAESVHEEFSLDTLYNLNRFMDENGDHCFQWIVKKGKNGDNMEEFGVRFENEIAASAFAQMISTMGQQSATVIGEFSGKIDLVEKETEWEPIERDISVLISKTKRGDHFLSIQGRESTLFHSAISDAIQLDLEHPLVISFLGITPLSEDLRVLGISCPSQAVFDDISNCIRSIIKPRIILPSPQVADVEMWDEDDASPTIEKKSTVSRRKGRVSETSNRFLETGHKDESLAVVFSNIRKGGTGFQVYQTNDRKLDPVASLTKLENLIDPSAVMMHEADSKCLLLDPSLGRDKVFELDLERGKVVSEWTPGTGINKLLPLSKESQKTGNKVFMGMNERSIFAMDPRMKPNEHTGNRVYAFTYATNVKLSSGATDSSGHIVAGNRLGQLRLFDGETNKEGELKRAKTLLSNLTGDQPITHVDVTSNGEWILATCPNFLVLVRTVNGEKISGFSKSISADTSEPIILSLSPKDVSEYKLKSIQFTHAKFDGDLIVTSTGSLAILWNFKNIVSGKSRAYSIKPMKDYIVDIGNCGSSSVVAMYEDRLELARVSQKKN